MSDIKPDCEIVVYTDGAALGNPGPAGWAALLRFVCGGKTVYEKQISGALAHATNNQAELLAVIHALEAIRDRRYPVRVVADSQYVVNTFEKGWIQKWAQENWKKRPNADLWQRLWQLVQQFPDIRFEWTRGHATDPYNKQVDRLARQRARELQQRE